MHIGLIWPSDPKILRQELEKFKTGGSQFLIATGANTVRGEIHDLGVDDVKTKRFWVEMSWYAILSLNLESADPSPFEEWGDAVKLKKPIRKEFWFDGFYEPLQGRLKIRFLINSKKDKEKWPNNVGNKYGLYRVFNAFDPTNLMVDEVTRKVTTRAQFLAQRAKEEQAGQIKV